MSYTGYSDHLEKPLTEAETAELARLENKAAIAKRLFLLAARLHVFRRRQYPRWAALNAILPSRYYGAWSIPIARWPWVGQPWRLLPPQLDLTHGESSLLEELQARHQRPTALARLDHNPAYTNGWIARYERQKASEARPDLHPLLVTEALEKFEAELPEKKAYLQRFREDDPPAYFRHLDSLNKNAAAFRQHIGEELARFGLAQNTGNSASPDLTVPAKVGGLVPELSLRQAAMFYYYTDHPLTDNNAASLAERWGHTSKTSGQQLSKHHADWCELQEGELPSSKRELGVLERDLARVLPYLSGRAAERANEYQQQVSGKKKRGY